MTLLAVDNRITELNKLPHHAVEKLNLSPNHLQMLDLMTPDNIAEVCKNYHKWEFSETDKLMCATICDMLDYLYLTSRSVYRERQCHFVHETYIARYARHANTK
jgi:hypothetical protein